MDDAFPPCGGGKGSGAAAWQSPEQSPAQSTAEGCFHTFSSPVATLNTSSMTQPTARRAAPEECTSFQMVSLST